MAINEAVSLQSNKTQLTELEHQLRKLRQQIRNVNQRNVNQVLQLTKSVRELKNKIRQTESNIRKKERNPDNFGKIKKIGTMAPQKSNRNRYRLKKDIDRYEMKR